MNKAKLTKGYLTVASKIPNFYSMAINLAESILDYEPDAKITLVTEEKFLDGREKIFDKVIFCDNHYRAKLWGLTQSPYDITLYLDADTEVVHPDISKAFDLLGDNNLLFTELLKENYYAYKTVYFNEKSKDDYYKLKLNGGICLYDNSQKTKEFLNLWYEVHKKQCVYEWWPLDKEGNHDYKTYPKELSYWDQFTLWWLTNEHEIKDCVKVGTFPDTNRWNWYTVFSPNKSSHKDPIVIEHYSCLAPKVNTLDGGITT